MKNCFKDWSQSTFRTTNLFTVNVLKSMFMALVMLILSYTTPLPNFYLVNLQHSSCKHGFSIGIENIVNPDQIALSAYKVFSNMEKYRFITTKG